jgi:hypothetical protein
MNADPRVIFKLKLKQKCAELIEKRMRYAQTIIDDAQQSANHEQKSSAGDKYETSRAMNHLEKEMYARQLAENQRELAALQAINVNPIYTSGNPGAYLKCSQFSFFIGAGLGKQELDAGTVFFLSPNAPLAKLLQQKKVGDLFVFNKIELKILEIF